ncbi:ABC transporter ATP-binding protein [Paraburkholderia bonniea]|uniref:ABC transporter ATP-binding protein n=1 Tax=Paraburkholderia bonniea TaxID=2152891 RepID=UPI0012913BD2|nr:ABC transporter ATP-binding protein [Paraburkholderia bonniea]WJF90107.1 ABC transporter ATP-binding protein [Paraburkholderia bonniea]WJF93421.1 ABC transporter ATP-binding protein [Paraburkholderia bonniea]
MSLHLPRISLSNVSVSLPIYNARGRALKAELLRRTVGGDLGKSVDPQVVVINALDDVSVTLEHGDRVALVGRNGSGKTTLLRVLAGIYPPTKGKVLIDGRVSALTDMSMGMDMEATGYENVLLRAVVMGLSSKEADSLIPDIEEFTELGEYLRLPIRTYSAGMMLRLIFGISTAVQPEILLLDEMVGAGDAAFVAKARARIEGLIQKASIMVLASHDDHLVKNLCTKALWMHSGHLRAFGPVDEVIAAYHEQAGV